MTIDELMKENADVLIRMKEEDDRFDVRRLAHEYWNWDIIPQSVEYYKQVFGYIRNHPEEFKGAVPQ